MSLESRPPIRCCTGGFNRHYKPLLEDRLAHREILPGVAAAQPSPEESVGNAYLRYQRGEIGKVQLDHIVLIARLAAVDPRRKHPEVAYAKAKAQI